MAIEETKIIIKQILNNNDNTNNKYYNNNNNNNTYILKVQYPQYNKIQFSIPYKNVLSTFCLYSALKLTHKTRVH